MFRFKRNLPTWERLSRLCLSIFMGVVASYFLNAGVLQFLIWMTAGLLACTAVMGFCPAYAMLGRKTIGQ